MIRHKEAQKAQKSAQMLFVLFCGWKTFDAR
jgi:hypothetical protein